MREGGGQWNGGHSGINHFTKKLGNSEMSLFADCLVSKMPLHFCTQFGF